MRDAFVGIEVAFAKGKRLPIVICVREGSQLVPLPLRDFRGALPPRGRGNRIALDTEAVLTFALETLEVPPNYRKESWPPNKANRDRRAKLLQARRHRTTSSGGGYG